jgi:hypothetical protein
VHQGNPRVHDWEQLNFYEILGRAIGSKGDFETPSAFHTLFVFSNVPKPLSDNVVLFRMPVTSGADEIIVSNQVNTL